MANEARRSCYGRENDKQSINEKRKTNWTFKLITTIVAMKPRSGLKQQRGKTLEKASASLHAALLIVQYEPV
jgi:hypothetical protein